MASRTNFVAAAYRSLQRSALQQSANHADGKTIAGAHGIHDVIDFDGGDCALFACGGFERAVAASL